MRHSSESTIGAHRFESSRAFLKAVETMSYGVLMTEARLERPGPIITFANAAMSTLTGYSNKELVGATPRLFHGPKTDRTLLERLKTTLLERRSFSGETVNYRKDGSPYIVEWIIDPLFNDTGHVEAWVSVQRDVTLNHQNRLARRRSEERLRAIFENADVGLSELDRTGNFVRANKEMCRILERSETELLSLNVSEVTYAEDVERTAAVMAEVKTSGRTGHLDKCYKRPNGDLVWVSSSVSLLRDEGDHGDHLLVVTTDLTSRRLAEAAIRESQERFEKFGAATSDVLWIRDAKTLEFEYLSPAFEQVYGLPPGYMRGQRRVKGWASMIMPEDRTASFDAIRRACAGEYVTWEYRIRRRSDSEMRWIRDTAFPINNAIGQAVRIGGISEDATATKESAEEMQHLIAELQHRTRNLLSVVRSLSERTLESSQSIAEYDLRFGDRLNALSRVNSLLSRLENGRRIGFDELLHAELDALGPARAAESGKISLDGPAGVRLRSRTVQTFALALHELAANAAQHGALSQDAGRLSIRWRLETSERGKPALRVEWREAGVIAPPPNLEHNRRGYGLSLIERALPYQLDAETRVEATPDGICCTITMPMSDD